MTPELIAVVAVGVALAGIVLVALRESTRILRAEIKDVRAEVKDLREETNKQFESVRAEIRAEREERNAQFEAAREDTNKQFESVRAEIEALRADMAELRERMARIEGMFEGFLRREPAPEPTPAAA